MTLVQSHYRGRNDSAGLNEAAFDHPVDTGWTQVTGETFRVRFEVEETAASAEVFTPQLEADLNGGGYFNVTDTSGTVTAALSDHFADTDTTLDVIGGSSRSFTAGRGSTSGQAVALTLNNQHTEVEFAVRLGTEAAGGTVSLRVDGADTYTNTPELVAVTVTDRSRVRLKVGDSDSALLTDSEIDIFLTAWPSNVELAAADAAEAIAAKYSKDFNFSTDGQVFNRRERVIHYMDLADRLRKRGGTFEWPRT